jgi:hypothetical protein
MSTLETLVQAALRAADYTPDLATWDGKPAVFILAAPDDESPLWGARQYPRIVVTVDRRWTPAGPQDGTLRVTVQAADPAPIERVTATILDGAYWHPTQEPDASTRRIGAALEPDITDVGELVYALTATYDVVSYAAVPAYDPNPIAGAVAWTEQAFSAIQTAPATWSPADANPAVYWRIVSPWTLLRRVGLHEQHWQVTLRASVLAPTEAVRLEWSQKLAQRLVQDRRLPLPASAGQGGDRLMRIAPPIEIDVRADPLRDGQLAVRAVFTAYDTWTPDTILENLIEVDPAGNELMEVS